MKIELIGSVDVPLRVMFDDTIKANARILFIALKLLMNRGEINPTNRYLADILHCDERTIIRNLLILEEKGVIQRVYDGSQDDIRTGIYITVA